MECQHFLVAPVINKITLLENNLQFMRKFSWVFMLPVVSVMTFYTSYYGDQRDVLGFERFASVGTGIEVGSSEKTRDVNFQ
jgi:hypothetical protein